MFKQRNLKMDFSSFDKDFKQLCTLGFMQEYRDHTRFFHALTFAGSSVVECLTRDRRAAGSSLTGVTALCP